MSHSNRLSCIVRRPLVLALLAVGLGLVPCGVVGLGIVLVLATPFWVDGEEQTKVRRALADIRHLDMAVTTYMIENVGREPKSLSDVALPQAEGARRRDVLDPWGRPYRLAPPEGIEIVPRVVSLGRDGKPGGAGVDADLDSEDARRVPEAQP